MSCSKKRVAVQQEGEVDRRKARRINSKDVDAENKRTDSNAPSAAAPPPSPPQVSSQVNNLLDSNINKAENAIDALIALNLHKEENSAIRGGLKLSDIIQNLVVAMKHNVSSLDIQSKACKLMFDLTFEDEHFKDALLSAGAAKAIGEAMELFRRDEKMQRYGCGALCSLSCSIKHAKKMFEDGMINVVLQAMKDHPRSVEVAANGSGSFNNILISFPACSNELMTKGCIEAAVSAMESHLYDKTVQNDACCFLTDMAEHIPNASDRIKEKGGAVAAAKTELYFRGKDENVHGRADKLLKSLFRNCEDIV
jgi:hypothetical protein